MAKGKDAKGKACLDFAVRPLAQGFAHCVEIARGEGLLQPLEVCCCYCPHL